jgi:hypothetical protein
MVIAVTTDRSNPRGGFASPGTAVLWKAWQESRSRFLTALALLVSVVIYAVVTGPDYLDRYNSAFPDKPELYSAYVWGGLFHYALQGLWILAAFIITLGGLRREKATGVAFFMLGLPVNPSALVPHPRSGGLGRVNRARARPSAPHPDTFVLRRRIVSTY